ncbi:MAG: hypothetical protein AAF191_05820, partial [Verrucomicrobiota bacterium]
MQPFGSRQIPSFDEIEPEFLLKAYQLGVFPMAKHDGEIAWFSPDPRGVIRSWVMGKDNASGGVIPWIKLLNDTAIAVNQGGRRA